MKTRMQQIALVFARFAWPSQHAISGLLIAVAMASAASAQTTATWYGSGTSAVGGTGTWNTSGTTNWSSNGTSWFAWNNTTNNSDTAVFAGTSGTVTLGTAITAGGLQFDTTGYTITGNTLTLAGAAPQITVASTAIGTITSALSGTGGITKAGAGTLSLSGANTYTGTTTITSGTLQIGAGGATGSIANTSPVSVASGAVFAFNRSDNLTYSGTVSGAGGLVKLGTGTLTLSSAGSSYSGGTWIDGGTVIVGNTQTAGGSGPLGTGTSTNVITINSGTLTGSGGNNAWLDNNNTIASGGGNAHSVVINSGGMLRGAIGRVTGLGNVTLNGGTIEVVNGLVLSQWNGPFALAGDITVSGSLVSRITTAAGATTSANMQMSNGAGNVGGTRTFTVDDVTGDSQSDLVVSARLANGTVVKAGAGTLELASGMNGTGTPVNWQVSAGTLLTTWTNAIGAGTVNLASSGTFDLGGQSNLAAGTITLAGSLLNSATSAAASTSANVNLSGTSTAQIGGPGGLTLSGTVSNGGFTKVGAGTLILSGSNTYTGTATVASGTLQIGAGGTAGSIASASAVSVTSGATLVFNRSDALTYGGAVSGAGGLVKLGSDQLVLSGTNTYTGTTTIASGTLQIGNGGTAGSISDASPVINSGVLAFNRSDSLTYGGTVSGIGGLSKAGSSLLSLTGANTYTGATTITAGTLQIGSGGATGSISDSSAVGVSSGAVFAFNRSDSLTYGGTVSGAGGLAQLGSNVLILSQNQSYTGTTTIASGTLQIGNGGTTGSISDASPVANRGVLAFSRSDALTHGGTVSGTGGLSMAGSSLLSLTGANTYTGATTITAGTLQIGAGGTTGSIANTSPVSVASGAMFAFNRSDNLTYGGTVSGAGGLVKLGAGTLSLSGANTYAGTTTITSGSLQIGAGGATGSIANSSPVSVASSAVFAFNRSDNLTYGGTVSGAGGLVKLGANTLTLTGSSSYTGGTRIDGGIVNMSVAATPGSTSALGTSTSSNVITINSGTLTSNGVTNGWLDSTAIASGGGNAHSVVINAGGALRGTNGWITGLGNVTLNGGTILVSQGVSGGAYRGSFTLAGDITVSGSVASSIATVPGAQPTANMQMSNGADGVGGTRTFTVNDVTNSSASDLIVSARLANGTVVKAGAGTLELASGMVGDGTPVNWQVNAGTLLTSTNGAIGTGTVTLASSGTFDLGGHSGVTVGRIVAAGSLLNSSTIAASTAGPVDLSGTNTAQIGGPGSLTLSGTVSNGGFTKVGSGTLTLSAVNTFSGTTRVNAGVLSVTNASGLQNSTLDMNSGDLGTVSFGQDSTLGGLTGSGNLDLSGRTLSVGNNNASTAYSGILTNGGLTKIGTGTFSLAGSNTYSGTTAITAGTLQIGSGGTTGSISDSSPVSVSSGAVLAFNRSDSLTYSGSVSGAGGLLKSGANLLSLAGANTYSGATTIAGGILSLGNANALGGGGNVVFTGGTLQFTSSNTADLSSRILNSSSAVVIDTNGQSVTFATALGASNTGGFRKVGSGTLTLTAASAGITGGTTLDGGVLRTTAYRALGTSAITINTGTLELAVNGDNALGVPPAPAVTINAGGALRQAATTGNGAWLGTLTLNGGQLESNIVASLGRFNLTDVVVGGVTQSAITANTVSIGSGTFTVNDVTAGTDLLVSSVITSFAGGPLNKAGAGTMVLTGANTYTAATTVLDGRLEIAPTGRINSTSGITINGSGAELKYNSATPLTQPITFTQGMISGTGVIGTLVTVGTNDIIAPGNSPGIQPYAAGLTWAPGGTYEWEFNAMSGTPGTSWDLVDVTSGTFSLTGLSTTNTFLLDLITLTGGNVAGPLDSPYVPGSMYSFLIADFGGSTFTVPVGYSTAAGSDLTGLFSFNLAKWQGPAPSVSDISVKVNSLGTGIELVVVPEPGTLALAAMAMVGVGWMVRRKRRAAA